MIFILTGFFACAVRMSAFQPPPGNIPRGPLWCHIQFAKHYETGETLPNDLFEKLCAQRTYMAGTAMLRQLYFGQVMSSNIWTS